MFDIKKIFSAWGQAQRQIPSNNEILKSEILNRLPELSGVTAQRKLPWLSLAFAGFAVIALIVMRPTNETNNGALLTSGPQNISESMENDVMIIAYPDFYPISTPTGASITDTREYSKIDYRAQIKTRNVSDIATRAQAIIHGFDGRIDSSSTSQKNGYMTFAVPARQFDAFRLQIRSLVGERFIIETTSAQNLLPQKQAIEQRREEINKQITDLKSQRSQLIATHNRTVANLQARINASVDEQEIIGLRGQLASENAAYNRKLASYNQQIKDYETNLEYTNKQDQNLINNVATVNGTISLRLISVWEVLDLYFGPYWLAILLGLIAIISYFFNRRRILMPLV